jgi:hypothetical protein
VVGELILAEGVEEECFPLIVVQRKIVEDDQNEDLDVEDGDNLHMKSGDGGLRLQLNISGWD